ncbi:7505_t:CDS:2 [Diversispora eburnea]|uniref:7505_t:CDS:1 n=1 Tax=Diversispora eburnea TaxID=1213867 RepID=A0A9N9BCC8_9GLOM|nr:7505_t:CDS:2 [Diversispora eburnea]
MKLSHFCLLTTVFILLFSSWWCFALPIDNKFKKLNDISYDNQIIISVKERIQFNNNDDHETTSFPEEKILSNNNDEFISNFPSINATFPSIPSINITLPSFPPMNETFSHIKDFVNEHFIVISFIVIAIIGAIVGYFAPVAFVKIIKGIGFQVGILAGSPAAKMMSICGTGARSIVPKLQFRGAAGFNEKFNRTIMMIMKHSSKKKSYNDFVSNFTSVNLTFPSIPSISVALPLINEVTSSTKEFFSTLKEFFSNITESIKDFVNEHKVMSYIVITVIGAVVGCITLKIFVMIIRCKGFREGVYAGSSAATLMSICGTAAYSIIPILQSIGSAGFSGSTYTKCSLLFVVDSKCILAGF